jgi:hypothetical protein
VLDRPIHSVTLLTPPDLVAVQRRDGTWYRRARNEETDGPAPYSEAWYLDYLRSNEVPLWFMMVQHNNVLKATDEREDIGSTYTPPPTTTDRGYLQARYPAPSTWPYADVLDNRCPYEYNLSVLERSSVLQHFPFVNVLPPPYSISVLPSGHIVVREGETTAAADRVDTGDLPFLTNPPNRVSSYVVESAQKKPKKAKTPAIPAPIQASALRARLIAAARSNGGIGNPSARPSGHWQLRWLNEATDSARARSIGYDSPAAVLDAREAGALQGAGSDVVFHPNQTYQNADTQPTGRGHFEYLTNDGDGSARALAEINFGG